jgi:hypothetical protein
MKPRSFIIGCIILTVAVMLCATPVIGPMVGFFVGIAIAFFGVPLIMLVGGSLGLEYSTANLATIGQYVAIGYAMLMCIPVVVAIIAGARRRTDGARMALFMVLVMLAIPLGGWLAMEALAKAWP